MKDELKGKRIAILATDGFEEVELAEPRKVLLQAGAETYLVSPKKMTVTAWDHNHWSDEYEVDVDLEEANPSDYDALFLPGGVINPDKLRTNETAIKFVTHFFREEKPIAAICHGPQILIETGELEGRKMTSYNSIKTDLINAGVNWLNEEVVVDKGLITSRNPEDIPAFSKRMVEVFKAGAYREVATKR